MPKEKDLEKQEPTPEELLEERKLRGDYVEEPEPEADPEPEPEPEADPEPEPEDDPEPEPEPEDDPEPEPEPEADPEDEPGAKPDDPIMIPKSRFDEAQQKARDREAELKRRLESAEDRKVQETTTENVSELETELDTLDAKYAELLLEGELDKAKDVRKEWRQKQNDLFDIRLEQRSARASKDAIEGMRFDRQLAEYEVQYPVINPDSEHFNQDTANEVRDLMDAFENQGWNPVAALNKAVKYAVPHDSAVEKPAIDPKVVRDKRRVSARRKVADVAKKSPPDITDRGRDTDKIGTGDGLPDVTKMSPDQFAELSEKQLRELRGDTLTDSEANS